MPATKILILLSTYNGSNFLVEQLDSIHGQKGVDITLLIRDDGSKDNTLDLIYYYIAQYPALKIEVVKGENCGSTMSFTKLLQLAAQKYEDGESFDYYAFADQDDIWIENKLSVAVDKLAPCDKSKPAVYCSNTYLYTEDLENVILMRPSLNVRVTKSKALINNLGTGCTMVFNHHTIEYYLKHNAEKIWMHDYLIYMIGIYLGNVVYDDNAYIYYRQHSNNQVGASRRFSLRLKRWTQKYILNNNRDHEDLCINFLIFYRSYITPEDIIIIDRVAAYRKSLKNRVRLIFDKSIRFDSFFVDLRLIFRISMGRL